MLISAERVFIYDPKVQSVSIEINDIYQNGTNYVCEYLHAFEPLMNKIVRLGRMSVAIDYLKIIYQVWLPNRWIYF